MAKIQREKKSFLNAIAEGRGSICKLRFCFFFERAHTDISGSIAAPEGGACFLFCFF